MLSPIVSRIRFLSVCLLLLFGLCLSQQASEVQASPAQQSLETSVTRILNLIKDPGYMNPKTRTPLRRKIEDEVYHIFDFAEFSQRTVGQKWKSFTPAQQKSFSDAFAQLLLATYLSKIDGYNGEQVKYTGERANSRGDRVEINTSITLKSGKDIPVSYRMLPKGGSWVVFDVIVEGVSLVQNYRTQFGEILNTATPDELITRIRTKAIEAENGQK